MLTFALTRLLSRFFRFLRRLFGKEKIASPPDSPEVFYCSPPEFFTPLTQEEYKRHIELYKFGLGFAFKAITIFFLLVSGVLTLGLSPGGELKEQDNPIKAVLLITSFLVNIAMLLGFEVATYMWICLSRRVAGGVKWRTVIRSSLARECDVRWNELVAKLYSPSLTMMLGITTTLFIVFLFLLGKIMAHYSVWFCSGCDSLFPS